MQIDIRAATAADAAAVALVGQATFLETYADTLPGADIVAHCASEHAQARYAAWLGDPECPIWVAELEETRSVVGYVMLCPADLPVTLQPGDVELKRIYLLSKFQGGGVGARLMAAAVDGAREAGAQRLLLGVWRRNEAARAFYARQGFTEAGVRKFQVGANTYDDLVLARPLSARSAHPARRGVAGAEDAVDQADGQ